MIKQLEEPIADILAKYWLEENLYCGLSSTEVSRRLGDDLGVESTPAAVIAAFDSMERTEQVSTRETQGDVWAYPKKPLLEPRDRLANTDMGSYTRQLRLGGGQYSLRFFRRQVLDRYMQDPRYGVDEYATGGSLSMKSDYSLDPDTSDEDSVSIQHYLVAYDSQKNPALGVPLRYLGTLSVTHQLHWESYEIKRELTIDRDSYKATFEGEWTDRVSPFDAFLQELREINTLCDTIGWAHLFRETFEGETVTGFCWMTKPTAHALEDFIHTLDKLLSDNINTDFFPATRATRGRDGSTISLLENFLAQNVRLREPQVAKQRIAEFRRIRKLRRAPAHRLTDDKYEQELVHEQRDIVRRAYTAIRDLRLVFMLHPRATDYKPPDWLQTGRIG